MVFKDASVEGALPDLPGDILDGELIVGTERHNNAIPISPPSSLPIQLRITFDSTHIVTIIGRSIHVELFGEPQYVEDFQP